MEKFIKLSVSMKNDKMGPIPSVSQPAVITCRKNAPCIKDCYARRMEAYRATVHDAYARNLELYRTAPDSYFAQLRAAAALLDPKRVSFIKWRRDMRVFDNATNAGAILATLQRYSGIMEQRYYSMETAGLEKTTAPHIYIYIDELADLMQTDKETINVLTHLLRLGRAAGIHIVAATQDPSRRTLPAAIQQNFTAVFALHCRSAIESRQIIGYPGAEKLPLYGNALYMTPELYAPEKVKIELLDPDRIPRVIVQDSRLL